MAPDTAAWHRTAPTDKTQQHTEAALTTVGLRTATQAGWLNDWLHSGGLTIKDSGGKKQESNREKYSTGWECKTNSIKLKS